MLSLERMEAILKELREHNAAQVADLAARLFVSPSTIRRDLALLEREGLLRRTHGGAMAMTRQSSEIPLSMRTGERRAEKAAMGRLAGRLVRDDLFLALDATTTVASLLPHLGRYRGLKILTPSAQLALDALELPDVQVCCTGGWLQKASRSFVGEAARARMAEFNCDIAFFSARSADLKAGITDVNEEEVYLTQQMLEGSRRRVFLCDHTKLDQVSCRKLWPLSRIDCLITDRRPPQPWVEVLADRGVRLLYPSDEKE
jgi:DeoR/GlpR family transcriptional regulator of sugar metabolism